MSDQEPDGRQYEFTADHPLHRGDWVKVQGGGLPTPIEVRVDQAPDGRHVVTGIKIGILDQWRYEVTSETLRDIKLSEILAAYYEAFRPDYVAEMEASLAEVSYPRRPRGPDGAALIAFARTYRTELARQPYRAMSATARAHKISRATANRWAALCRELGYLPSSPGEGEQP